jgi:hypothetical protein
MSTPLDTDRSAERAVITTFPQPLRPLISASLWGHCGPAERDHLTGEA